MLSGTLNRGKLVSALCWIDFFWELGNVMFMHSLPGFLAPHGERTGRPPSNLLLLKPHCLSSFQSLPQPCSWLLTPDRVLRLLGFQRLATSCKLADQAQCRSSYLHLESSLRNYLTHLGQIIVSKETQKRREEV